MVGLEGPFTRNISLTKNIQANVTTGQATFSATDDEREGEKKRKKRKHAGSRRAGEEEEEEEAP